MYETKPIFLLSASLFLHAHVSNPNVTVGRENLFDRSTQPGVVTSDTLQNPMNAAHFGTVEKNVPFSSVTAFAKKPAMVKSTSSGHDKDDVFRNADRLEEQTDAVTVMLQRQLFAPHDGNLILQTVKKLPEEEKMSASVETIAAALKVRLEDALKKICPYDTYVLSRLTTQLAEVIYCHSIHQKRRFALFNPEDIHCMTADLYQVLQETDIRQLIVF